jgi:hypothetical protein
MDASENQIENMAAKSAISWKSVIAIQSIVITTIAIAVLFTYLGAFPFDIDLGIYRILPGDILFDFIWLYIISGVIGAVLYLVSPKISRFLWRVHMSFRGKNAQYQLQEISIGTSASTQIRRMLIPAFASLGISYSISNMQSIADAIVVTEVFADLAVEAQTIITILSLFFILLLVACFIMLIFSPIWLLQDIGLVCESEKKPGAIAEVEGVGNWYLKMMKGFAGISTIVAYIFTVVQTVEWYQFVLQSPPEGGFPILIFMFPVIAIAVAPLLALGPISIVYVLYEISLTRNIPKLRRYYTV